VARRLRLSTAAYATVALFALVAAMLPPPSRAADAKLLQRVKGAVGYQSARSAPIASIVGRIQLPDDYFAITRAQSAALLTLPDSSLVGLGENTDVQVGAFNQTAAGPGSTVTVSGGTLRFDIRRPQGGTANYRFLTPTSQIAVRGTIGLLSVLDGNTSVACLACAPDSVTVTVGAQTYPVLTGQMLTVSASGVVAEVPLTGTALGAFSVAGVSTSVAAGPVAATAGVVPATSGAGTGVLGAIVGAGVVAGAVAAASSGSTSSPQTFQNVPIVNGGTPTPTPSPTSTATSTPAPNATPTATFSVTGKTRPSAAPASAAAPPLQRGRHS
jgi:hypothetical protein